MSNRQRSLAGAAELLAALIVSATATAYEVSPGQSYRVDLNVANFFGSVVSVGEVSHQVSQQPPFVSAATVTPQGGYVPPGQVVTYHLDFTIAPGTAGQAGVLAVDFLFANQFPVMPPNWPVQVPLVVTMSTGAPEGAAAALRLDPSHPNPFNPQTLLTYAVPAAGEVQLRVYDSQGRLVRTLVSATMTAGEHTATWDGADDGGRALPSGVYVCRLEAGSSVETRRLTLVR